MLTKEEISALASVQSKLTKIVEERRARLLAVQSGDYLYSKELDQLGYLLQQVKQGNSIALELASFLEAVPEKDYDNDRSKHRDKMQEIEGVYKTLFESFL